MENAPPPKPGHGLIAEASPWVRRFAPLVAPGGVVLDLAAGGGRHARYFLSRGHPVVAIDRDTVPLADLEGRAEVIQADLEAGAASTAAWGGRTFAGVVVCNYLHRPLMPYLLAAVAPGGVLIYETFARGNERFGKPRNPDFLLEPGELLTLADAQFHVISYEHGLIEGPRVVQRMAAVNAPRDEPPRELYPE
jgi:SAM-dependent methyltransferase